MCGLENKSDKHKYEPDLNPQLVSLQDNTITIAISECPVRILIIMMMMIIIIIIVIIIMYI